MRPRLLLLALLTAAACSDPSPSTSASTSPSTSTSTSTSTSPSPSPSTSTSPSPSPSPAPTPTWLYEIPTATQSSYVFAALDPGCPLHEAFPADYALLFQLARVVIVADAQTQEEAHRTLVETGVDRSGSLGRAIGPERLATLTDEIGDVVPPPVAPFLRPVWALQALVLAIMADAYGADASDGRLSPTHDAVMRCRMAGAPVVGLYDHDAIAHALSRLAPLATDALRAELDHLDEERASARTVLAAYRAADEAALAATFDDVSPGTERFARASAAERRRMLDAQLDTIETELRAGNALVLLSAVEVLGDEGLLARLRADGLTVTRVAVVPPAP